MLNSLRVRFILILLSLAVLPLLVVSFLIVQQGYNALQHEALVHQSEVAVRVSGEIDAFLRQKERDLIHLVRVSELQTLSPRAQVDLLNRLMTQEEAFIELVLLSSTGQEVLVVNELPTGAELSNRVERYESAFTFARDTGQVYYSSVRFDEAAHGPLLTIAVPVFDLRSGHIANVLLAELSFKPIWDLIADLDLVGEGDVYVIGAGSLVVAHKNPSVVLRGTTYEPPSANRRAVGLSGTEVIQASAHLYLGDQEFVIVAEEPFAQATALATDLLTISIVAIIVAGIFALGMVIGSVRYIVRPVEQLSTIARAIQDGDLSRKVEFRRADEIGKLAAAFTDMTGDLQRLLETERASKEYLEQAVAQYTSFAQSVAGGNLTTRLSLGNGTSDRNAEDDLYLLGETLNEMVERLGEMTRRVRQVAASVSSAAAEIMATTNQQQATAAEQSASVTQTASTVEEVRTTVLQTATRAQAVTEAAQQSVDVTRIGQTAVADTVEGMDIIRQQVEAIAENILALSERTQQIGEIIDAVNDIAEQSKLLALNASIEAARAGEEGRGFAVVAMEVRQLAEQSHEATSRVREILNEIQAATNTAVMVTEEGSKGTQRGMSLVKRAGEAIQDLAATIEESAQAASQIAASTRQQTNGMDQLATAMQAIKQASVEAAASTQQADRSARELNELAKQMEEVVARYQL